MRGKPTLAERFWAKFRRDPSGCWIWTAALGVEGYGCFGVPGHRVVLAHRFAYELLVGPIPEGLQIDHLCAVKACVNPSHLEPVTGLVNTRRALPWVNGQARRTHCPREHPYTPENTRYDPRGGRHCRICDRLATDRRTEQRRQARVERWGFDPGPLSRKRPA